MNESNLNANNNEKLRLGTKLAYGSFEFAGSLSLVALTTWGMIFMTNVAGVPAGIAGTLLAIGSVVSAIAAPTVGILSDGCKSKYGRRRPFLIASAIPSGLILWLVFTNFGFSGKANIAYFAIVIILYYIIMAIMDVPFTSLGAEMTKDYDERSSLSSYRSLFSLIASIIAGSVVMSIAGMVSEGLGVSTSAGWSITSGVMGFLCTLVILNGWRATKGTELHREESEKASLKDFGHVFKNKVFVYTACLYSSGIAAYAVGLVVQVYFLYMYMGFTDGMVTIALVIYNLSSIVSLPLIPFLSKKYSKRIAWFVMMGIWALATIATFIFVRPGDFIAICVINAFAGAGGMVCYTVGWAMLPDCIEIDEYKYNERKEGTYYGVLSIIQKGSAALITMLTGIALQLFGYDGTAEVQTATAIEGIRIIYVFGVLFFIALSFVFAAKYPLNRKKHEILLDAIEAKKEGKDFDTSELDDII